MPKWEQPQPVRSREVIEAIQATVGSDVEISVKVGGGKVLKVEIPAATQATFNRVMTELRTRWPEMFL